MGVAEALAELRELSSQVRDAVVLDDAGTVLGSTGADEGGAERLAAAARELLSAGAELHAGSDVTRVEVEVPEGGVFVVREADRTIAAATEPDATAGLVVYDLRTCLHRMAEEKPKRRSRRKTEETT